MNSLIEELISRMPGSDIYPKGVVHEIRPKVRGRSFFPGGCGLSGGFQATLRSRPIMLVGQDFGNLDYWSTLDANQDEKLQGTWSGLMRMIQPTGVDLSDCFLSNALLGVRISPEIDGPSPGLDYSEYVGASVEFLLEQIRIVQPSVVVTLGAVPTSLVARKLGLASALRAPTSKKVAEWKEIDDLELQVKSDVIVLGCKAFTFASSVHPDRYWLHTKHRSFGDLKGADAHLEIWKRVKLAADCSAK